MFGKLREKYQKAMTPVGSVLAKIGLTPNILTIMTLVPALFCTYFYAIRLPVYGALMIVMTGILDMFDGAVARALNKLTRFGATFDHVIDRYSEFLIMLGIIAGGYCSWVTGIFTLFGMLMASFTRAKAESVGGLKSCTVGIAERQEKLLLLISGSILVGFFPEIMNYAVIITGFLSHITVYQRLQYTWVQTGGN